MQWSMQVGRILSKQIEKFKYLGDQLRMIEGKMKNWMIHVLLSKTSGIEGITIYDKVGSTTIRD